MNVILTPHQQIVNSELMRALDGSVCNNNNLGVLLVGSPGVGMSTCIDQFKKITNQKFIVLEAIDSQSVGSLGEWLGKTLGLDDVRVSLNVKISLSLVSMLKIIGVSMLILEDAHVMNSHRRRSRTLDRIIDEFRKLKSKIPGIQLLMSIQAVEMSGINFAEPNLSNLFHVIKARPMTFDDLMFFAGKTHLKAQAGSRLPVFSHRVLLAVYKFSEGSIGRAIFIIELLQNCCVCEANLKQSEDYIIRLISTLKG
jgi:hypothetical protein